MTSSIERTLIHRAKRFRKNVKLLSKNRMKGVGGVCIPTLDGWLIKSIYGVRRYRYCSQQEAYQRYQVDVLDQIRNAVALIARESAY